MNQINDLGYGICPYCKHYKMLTHFDPKTKGKKRKDRLRCCANCAHKVKAEIEPFYRLGRSISNHKVLTGEGDYNFTECMRLYALQGGLCAYCGKPIPYNFTIEHIVPRKFGGRNLLYNILLICQRCNSKKQHFELSYWLKKMGYKLVHRLILRVKEAYDKHGYEFTGTCDICSSWKTDRCRHCKTEPTSAKPTESVTGGRKVDIQSGQVSRSQTGTATLN